MGPKLEDMQKVFNLGAELIENNQKIAVQEEKAKGIKDVIKAFKERNEEIMNEMEVRTGDQETFDLGEGN
jgi:hypothetical protein